MTSSPLPQRLPLWRMLLAIFACLLCIHVQPAHASSAKTETTPSIIDADIGFAGTYKLGCWSPLSIEVRGGSEAWTGRVAVTLPDTDGVPTRVLSPPAQVEPGQLTRVSLFVRAGQASSPLLVALLSDDGSTAAQRTIHSRSQSGQGLSRGLPATNRVLLEVGPTLNLEALLQTEGRTDEQLATRIAHVESADELPTEWYGYESVETVLLTTSAPTTYESWAKNPDRLAALLSWIERGGQVVLFSATQAEQLLADDGVLAPLSPGTYEKMKRLSKAQPLATFSGSEQPISRDRRVDLPVPSFLDVPGQILASAGRSATNVPLVVRTRHGLGEIVFVGLDFDQPPLNEWGGRTSFLLRLLDWQSEKNNRPSSANNEVEDLTGHLRNSLDKQFVGVQIAPFGLVALLVGVYLLLLGPGDFFFVKRVLRRMELTWLTFPLIVLGVSAAAYGIANYLKGDQLRVNQVEIIDVDCTDHTTEGHFVRGTVWTHFFTPEVSQLDLSLQPSHLGQAELAHSEQLVSWLGLPGYALGGMQASGAQTSVFDAGYEYSTELASMQRLPSQVWSTKTLTARWSARVQPPIHSELRQDGEELLVGQIRNDSAVELEDCLLLYGRWAFKLNRLPAGKQATIDNSLQPRTVKTLLTNATAGDDTITKTAEDGTVPFPTAQWDVARLIKSMMFYDAVNGPSYTGKAHRYQSFVDISDLLKHDDQAILLARCKAPGTQWLINDDSPDGGPLASTPLASDQDRRWTYYRFVLNVEPQQASE